jgi:hypothetical protein
MGEYVALSAFEQIALQKENGVLTDALRHHYAAFALNGLLSNPEYAGRYDTAGYAKKAVECADAVIARITQPASSDVQPTPATFVAS